jgi:hypothetical protein
LRDDYTPEEAGIVPDDEPPPPIGRDAPQPGIPLPFDSDDRIELTAQAEHFITKADDLHRRGESLKNICDYFKEAMLANPPWWPEP